MWKFLCRFLYCVEQSLKILYQYGTACYCSTITQKVINNKIIQTSSIMGILKTLLKGCAFVKVTIKLCVFIFPETLLKIDSIIYQYINYVSAVGVVRKR